MILVTVGISNLPFERLLSAVDKLPRTGEELVVQCGPAGTRPRGALCVDYLPFADFDRYVRDARVVICHAGIGSVGACLTSGRHPIVVPRLKQHGEAVDDHQRRFARRLAELGLASSIEDVRDLADAVRTAPTRQPATGLSTELADELVAYIGQHAATSTGNRPTSIVREPRA
jgi:UDP-N-acetylglucosamine transferase subunit ALG13